MVLNFDIANVKKASREGWNVLNASDMLHVMSSAKIGRSVDLQQLGKLVIN